MNKERTGFRSSAWSALLRHVPSPARHLDIDSIQYCGRCNTPSFVAEWTRTAENKSYSWTEKVARAIGCRALLVRSDDPITHLSIRDGGQITKVTPQEFVSWATGLLSVACRCTAFPAVSFLRYIGGKGALSRLIARHIPLTDGILEPFAGSAAVTGLLLAAGWPLRRIHLNDADPGIIDLWRQVHEDPTDLLRRIREFAPSLEEWDWHSVSEPNGFSTLVLGAMSFGALGRAAGGPIGGRGQESRYSVGCRWNPEKTAEKILWWHRALAEREVKITCDDACRVLENTTDFSYVDPPYFMGAALYENQVDHTRLRITLERRAEWLLSIDDPSQYTGRAIQIAGRKTTLGIEYPEWLVFSYSADAN